MDKLLIEGGAPLVGGIVVFVAVAVGTPTLICTERFVPNNCPLPSRKRQMPV